MHMKPISLAKAAQVMGGTLVGGGPSTEIQQVVMDSRRDVTGALFVAIPGNRVDGHDFVSDVHQRDAVCALVEREIDASGPLIVVDSTLRAIRDLAAYYRSLFDIPVIGITGSVGKTGTKEMIAAVLATKYSVHKTEGNFNNEIGTPMTIFGLREHHQVFVAEMGISDFGEMARLTEMVRPDIAVFTIIGYAHIEFLGSREGVLKAKGEMVKCLNPDGLFIANGDDDILRPLKVTDLYPEQAGVKKLIYGLTPGNDYRAEHIVNLGENGVSCTLCWGDAAIDVTIPVFGEHMVYAALAAAAVGAALGLSPAEIARGIESFTNADKRSDIFKTDFLTIIDDSYNANPTSVEAAITALAKLPGRRVAVIGDMGELGTDCHKLHHELGAFAARSGVDCIVCAGPLSEHTYRGVKDTNPDLQAWYFPDKDTALEALPALLQQGDQVLVKASRSGRFEDIVTALRGL
ncbi:MAG: UDP-N-acetylmuramoyl-tripeptide--D-alanyl-D-alanine ligase [Oscillospiraceae bacterium]|nr:UDP-N-acetylmuramoyl-tripeptide--D-alanyl-D-alanine ligase [Oscillospiraceae bacterium]